MEILFFDLFETDDQPEQYNHPEGNDPGECSSDFIGMKPFTQPWNQGGKFWELFIY